MQKIEKKNEHTTLVYWAIILLAFVLYANTVPHDYVFDDSLVITENKFTTKGIDGIKDILSHDAFLGRYGEIDIVSGGRYRPLSFITFAIEYDLFGPNPHISHIVNIVLYALTGILIFKILSKLLAAYQPKRWYLAVPFIASLFFIAHPVHTEVVANIKSRDEILALLFSLVAMIHTLNYLDKNKARYLVYSSVSLFLALLAKENAITFLVVIPLAIYFFTGHSKKRGLTGLIPLFISAAIFLIIRQLLIGSVATAATKFLLNNPFLHATVSQKYATIAYTLGVYLRLLFFPHPLTYDYYPYHIPLMGWTDPRTIISLAIYIALIAYAATGLRKKWVTSFGIWYYLFTIFIVSNIIFNVGVFMAERLVYMPSLGFCIAIPYILCHKLPIKTDKNVPRLLIPILIIILMLYSFKTITRNEAWGSDFDLFTTDVKTSFDSAKSNDDAASVLIAKAQTETMPAKRDEAITLAIEYLNRALKIDPEDRDAMLMLGSAHYLLNQDYDKTFYYYKGVLGQDPHYHKVHHYLAAMLKPYNNTDHKLEIYKELFDFKPDRYETNYMLGVLYSAKDDLDNSLYYFERAMKYDPLTNNSDDIEYIKTAQLFDKIIGRPSDEKIYNDLGLAFQRMGNKVKAEECFKKAAALK